MSSTTHDRTHTWAVGTAPGIFPPIGHAIAFLRRPLQFLASLPAHGDLVEIRLGPQRAWMACHPQLVRRILLDPRTFEKGGPIYGAIRVLLGDGLVTCGLQSHRRQRRLVQQCFRPGPMARHAVTMSRLAVAMAGEWRPGATLDVEDAMTTLTSRVTGHVLMSDSLDAATAAEVRRCLPVVMRGVLIRAALPRYERYRLLLPDNRRFERSLDRLHRIVDRIIEQRRRTGADHGDLLAALLSATDDDGDALSDQEVHDQVITFLAAAIDTTAQALAWTYRLLADHPDAEHRLHAELDTVLDGGRPPRLEDLPRLVHTRRVVTESLRMYPPGWIFTRVTTTATTLAGQRLPAGATILYSPYALHHDPASFTDPERFDPDRWTPGREADVPRGAMLPFGAGSRKCAGDTFAMTQALLSIAAISTHWRLRPLTAVPTRPPISAILGPGPLPMTCEPRREAGRRKTGE